ncbi:hypothetical protein [Leifsonia aquatica]|uniref:hypothetical protein n=1 Tax=Leifsonia aquatica TaxID=144185 RepID=UPI0028B0F016|nr:hypothetical protein [Leifsonia aquatica]
MNATQFEDINDLVGRSQLDDIVVHEERARRVVWPSDAEFEAPDPSLSFGFRKDGNRLHFRFRIVLADENAEYVADLEGVYSVEDSDELSLGSDLIQEFAGRVALMAIYPFMRVSVFGSAGRLGLPRPILSMIRQGDFQPGEQMSDDDVRAVFADNRSELNQD